jgi:hypothetical protein
MPDSEDPKQVNNDLRNAQFRGGLINADKVIAGQIGGDNYNLIQQQIVIEVRTTPQSKLPFLQREVFKPLIENRLALFGGRITVLTHITEFIKNLLSGYLVITAPAGFGKTSLMAKLVSEATETLAYHFFAPSISDHSITEEGFLKNVIEQMAQWHNYTDSLPEKLPDLKALYQSFLDRPLKHPHVLIIDGLDEVRGWNLTPYVSRRLPENLHIILTVRDVGQDWIGDYDLPKEQTEHLSLKGLSTEDVAEVIRAAGKQAIILADNHKFIDEVMTVAAYQEEPSLGADPFYLRLLAENAADGYLTLDNIVNQPKGLERYLDRWWDEINKSAGEQCTRDLFGTLTVALGKISRRELEAINKDTLVDDWAVNFFDDVVKQVRRFVMGNEEQGYAIAHLRLRQHMRTRIRIDVYNRKILSFCDFWQEHHSLYALRYYAEHLEATKQWEKIYALARNKDFAFLQHKYIPNELNLLLKTIQIALYVAVETNNAAAMAEFSLLHAQFVLQMTHQESPLKLLRNHSLQAALELADLYEIKLCILWYLLLIWELIDEKHLDKVNFVLQRLQKKELARFPEFDQEKEYLSRWQGSYVAYILAHISLTHKADFINLYQRLLDGWHYLALCHYLIKIKQFSTALDVAKNILKNTHKQLALEMLVESQAGELNNYIEIWETIPDDFDRKRALEYIVKAQAQAGKFTEAFETVQKIQFEAYQIIALLEIIKVQAYVGKFDAAIETARKLKHRYVEALGIIAKRQAEIGQRRAALSTLVLALEIPCQADSITQQSILEEVAKIQAQIGAFDEALETVQRIISESGKIIVIEEIAKTQANLGNFTAALRTADSIKSVLTKLSLLCEISKNPLTQNIRNLLLSTLNSIFESARQVNIGDELLKEVAITQARLGNFANALEIAEGIGDKWQHNLAIQDVVLEQTKLGFLDKAIHAAETIYIEDHRAFAFLSSAMFLEETGEYTEVRSFLARNIEILIEPKREDRLVRKLATLARVIARGEDFQSALQVVEKIENPVQKVWTLAGIAMLQQRFSQQCAALTTLTNAVSVAQEIQEAEQQIWAIKIAVQAFSLIGEFSIAINTSQKITYELGRVESLKEIGLELVNSGNIDTAFLIYEEIEQIETKLIEKIGHRHSIEAFKLLTVLKAKVGDFPTAMEAAMKINEVPTRQRTIGMIAIEQAKAGNYPDARKTLQKIDELWVQVETLGLIAAMQAQSGNKQLALSTFSEAWDRLTLIYEESKRSRALQAIAKAQIKAGFNTQALQTTKMIIINRDYHLLEIAFAFSEVSDKKSFQTLLLPCAYHLDSVYEICIFLTELYPEQAKTIANIITTIN